MRLVYLANVRLPTEKAHGYQIMKMCESFAQIGTETMLLYPYRVQSGELQNSKDVFRYYNVAPCFQSKKLYSIDWHILLNNQLQKLWFLMQAASYAVHTYFYTMRWWKDETVIFYSRDLPALILMLQSRRLIKAKLVFEAHTYPGRRIESRVISLFRHIDKLVVITHQLKRLFSEAGIPAEKIIVAPDAVDLDQFQIKDSREECRTRLGLPLNRPIIGYIGRFQTMGMEKGISDLIQATGYLIFNSPLLLCVGGPMDSVPQYMEIAKKHNVPEENLKFVDRVPTSQVPYWIKACDIVTIPFPWNKHMAYYTSPMKLFEYMAVGTPIVASKLPSLCEILTDEKNAILTTPENIEELAHAFTRLLKESELRERLTLNSLNDIKLYTWKNRARHILQNVYV